MLVINYNYNYWIISVINYCNWLLM